MSFQKMQGIVFYFYYRVAPGEIYPFEYTATNYIEKINTSPENIQAIIDKQSEKKEPEKKKGKV